MAWCFDDEATAKTDELRDRVAREAGLVPVHWLLEVVNVLHVSERRKRITPAKSAEFLRLLGGFDIQVSGEAPAIGAADGLLVLCRAHALTAYDAQYLDLAVREGVPLGSLDDDLRKAASKLGVTLLGK
jgi:predicted nucleic acid-binding protein